jgi:DNA-binding CsgD family transcriptional regulator
LIRVLPIANAARGPFLGARVLFIFVDLGPKPGPDPRLLMSLFGLTTAEARLASLLAGGAALDEIAGQLGIARETARNQLKAVFAKTETHRQGELVALLSQLTAELRDSGLRQTDISEGGSGTDPDPPCHRQSRF